MAEAVAHPDGPAPAGRADRDPGHREQDPHIRRSLACRLI